MRVSRQEKALSHGRIVKSAARLVRERGVEATSVNDVMREASLTHGGFYRHFATKDDLLGAGLEQAFDEIFALIDAEIAAGREPSAVLSEYRKFYLSDNHAATPGTGCPVAAIGGEVARGSADLKQRFGNGVNRTIERLAMAMQGYPDERRTAAIRQFAMMAGAVMIARASDAATSGLILAACRDD